MNSIDKRGRIIYNTSEVQFPSEVLAVINYIPADIKHHYEEFAERYKQAVLRAKARYNGWPGYKTRAQIFGALVTWFRRGPDAYFRILQSVRAKARANKFRMQGMTGAQIIEHTTHGIRRSKYKNRVAEAELRRAARVKQTN